MKYLLVGILLLPSVVYGYETTVTRIVDGDTVVAQVNNKQEKIRIIGINTPESVDPRRPVECFGKEASAQASALLLNKRVTLEERDRHGRMLGYIKLSDGTDFGKEMIETGYAYSFKSYSHPRLAGYNRIEKIARKNSTGLWAPGACLESDETKELITEERITLIKQILDIIKAFIKLFQ